MHLHTKPALLTCLALAACGSEAPAATTQPTTRAAAVEGSPDLTYRSEVEPVTRVADAKPGVFIPGFRQCVPPNPGDTGTGPDGKVCSNVSISGATEPGLYFADYASCDVVVRQRPYWSAAPAGITPADDPRLRDAAYMADMEWARAQIASTGCVCCHDGNAGRPAAQWDIRAEGVWLDSLSDPGLALFAGFADSSVLGAYPAAENFGFDRTITGIPSTDSARMQRIMTAELARRGISEAQARAVPPFGGPIYTAQYAKPTRCKPGEGVETDGRVLWQGGAARYVYVLAESASNPGVPPNLDLPEGTLWKLDVLASAAPLASGIVYGQTPAGSFQSYPDAQPAAALEEGKTYHLSVLKDVGLPIGNCLFTYGDAISEAPASAVDAGAPTLPAVDAGGAAACTLAGGDAAGFGAACKSNADCSCAASYCAVQPGTSEGYCTKTGCNEDASVCPSGYACFDLSRFAPGLPAFCSK